MSEKNTKRKTQPMIIVDPESGKEYTLEFSRKSVARCEGEGLNINEVDSKTMTMMPLLFWGAFLMHHPYMTREQSDKILFDSLGGLTGKELGRLAELYAEPFNTLIAGDDEPENPRKMTVKI